MNKMIEKQKILEKFLEICCDQMWNENLISQTLIKCNIEKNLQPLFFQDPIVDLYHLFWQKIDEEMIKQMGNLEIINGTTNKITKILETRFIVLEKYRQPLSGFIKSCKSLKNLKSAIKISYNFSDLSWKLIRDQSTDYNYYTKRIILNKLYIKSLIFFDKNQSSDIAMKDFIATEMDNIIKITKIKEKLQKEKIKYFMKNNILSKIPFIRLKI